MITLGYKASFNKTIPIHPINIDDYYEIDIYTPIWAGKIAIPTLTFIKEHDFTNKKVHVFLNCEGGFGNSENQVRELLGDSLVDITLLSNKK